MRLYDLCQKIGAVCPENLRDTEIRGICSNSKEVKRGDLYFCLRGTKTDGHRYADEALMKGACAVVIEDDRYLCEKAVRVVGTRRALAFAMNAICGEPTKKLRFIGVTGTNGKTSVTVMIKHIFETLHIPCEIIGTLNCSSFSEKRGDPTANFTTPDPEELYPLLRRISDAGIENVVMEVSSHALALEKLAPIEFDYGIFTNLTEDHLDFHGDMEDYFKSKSRLFDKCKLGIINVDDEYGRRLKNIAKCPILSCSTKENADYFAENIRLLGERGIAYELSYCGGTLPILCRVPGSFSVMNSMQASALALEMGAGVYTVKRAFDSFSGVRGRLEKVILPRGFDFSVFIDYAHTPDALAKVLEALRSAKSPGARLTVVFGCGGDREREKRPIMGRIASELADRVIITSDNPRYEHPISIIEDICRGIDTDRDFAMIPDRRAAIAHALINAGRDEMIVLAGKGHENYEIIRGRRLDFDERRIVCEVIEKLKGGNEL